MPLSPNIQDLTTRIATQAKILKTYINGNAADLSALKTTAKANLVAAINELYDAASSGGASIDDDNISTLTAYSSSKTEAVIAAAIADLIDGAPETLDTLKELADALGDDPNFATTITNLIGTKADDSTVVKVTGSQTIGGVKTFSDAPVVPDLSFSIAKTTGLQTALDGKAAAVHKHSAADVDSGVFASARLPQATEAAIGAVERATNPEVLAGEDATRYVTPAQVKLVTGNFATKDEIGDTDVDFVAIFEAGLL